MWSAKHTTALNRLERKTSSELYAPHTPFGIAKEYGKGIRLRRAEEKTFVTPARFSVFEKSSSWFIDIEHSRSWPSSLLKQVSIVWYSHVGAVSRNSEGPESCCFHSRESSIEISIVLFCLSVTKQTGLVSSLGPALRFWFEYLTSGRKVIGTFQKQALIDLGPRPSFCGISRHSRFWICRRNHGVTIQMKPLWKIFRIILFISYDLAKSIVVDFFFFNHV